MPENQSKSGFNLPWANVMALMMAVGGFLTLTPSLDTSRPRDPGGESLTVFGDQTVTSRLWQDPFEEMVKPANRTKGDGKEHTIEAFLASMENKHRDPLVMIVMVSSGPHADARERRLRTRTAVVEGLSASGFAPSDSAHIGYLRLSWPRESSSLFNEWIFDGPQPPESERTSDNTQDIPFEWFEQERGNDGDPQYAVVLYLEEDVCRDRPFARLAYLSKRLNPGSELPNDQPLVRTAVLGPVTSGLLDAMVRELDKFNPNIEKDAWLLRMGNAIIRQQLRGMKIFCPTATASARDLVPDAAQKGKEAKQDSPDAAVKDWVGETIQRTFASEGLVFQRTIPTDEEVIDETIRELKRRGINPTNWRDDSEIPAAHRSEKPANERGLKDSIAIISELDTYYGRALPKTFGRQCGQPAFNNQPSTNGRDQKQWIQQYFYLRGLDGRLPGDDKEKNASSTASKEGQKRKAGARPDGHDQTDSLLRLAELLASDDRELRNAGKPGYRAIGVLGSDVYDKLLILRALRPMFPGVVFFTNNLDAQLSHPDEWAAAHNLVVVSGFGLRLHDRWQRNIPPFRDGYQTATFLGTLVATGVIEHDPLPMVSREQLPERALSRIMDLPRVFEIGRNGALDLSFNALGGYGTAGGVINAQVDDEILRIHPRRTDLKQWWSPEVLHLTSLGAWSVPLSLALGILCGCALLVIFYRSAVALPQKLPSAPPHSGKSGLAAQVQESGKDGQGIGGKLHSIGEKLITDWFTLSTLIASVFAATVAVLAVSAGYRSQWIEGEPFAWFEELSIWPGVAIRIFAIILAIHFVAKSHVSVLKSDSEIFERFSLGTRRDGVPKVEFNQLCPHHAFAPWSVRLRRDERPEGLNSALPFREGSFDARRLWRQYIWRGRWWCRVVRVGTLTGLFLLASWFAVAAFDGALGTSPARSPVARAFDTGSFFLLLISAAFVTLFVVDALYLNASFIRLFNSGSTRWPEDVLARSGLIGSLDAAEVAEELDIRLVATRTAAIGESVLYPFAIVALLVVSRAPYFDDWGWTTGLIIVLAALLGLATIAAVKLRNAAESARKGALGRLRAARIVASTQDGMEKRVRLLDAMITRVADLEEGAFAPISQQPIVRALLFPAGGVGVWEIARQVLTKF